MVINKRRFSQIARRWSQIKHLRKSALDLRISALNNLKNKKILITAGPTWVPIDDVRVISNIATGKTGILLAERLQRLGAKVTLLLGPVGVCCLSKKIRLIRFRFFDELKRLTIKELKSRKYDIIIHSAAVADFCPLRVAKGKLTSNRNHILRLKPLAKIVQDISRLAQQAKLVIFKLESQVSRAILLKRAKEVQAKIGADLVIANSLNPYRIFILDKKGSIFPVKNKKELVIKLPTLLNLQLIT